MIVALHAVEVWPCDASMPAKIFAALRTSWSTLIRTPPPDYLFENKGTRFTYYVRQKKK
jgi:hypothetical protein